ncbi:hypothetical protein D3C73_811470 [compost metagenome]
MCEGLSNLIFKFVLKFFLAILIGIIICFLICGKVDIECLKEQTRKIVSLTESKSQSSLNDSSYRKSDIKPDRMVVWQAKQYFKNNTKSPDSLQYRNVKSFFGKDGNSYACGEFNIKNSHDKYIGFRRFIFNGHSILIEGETIISFDSLIKDFCILDKLPQS